MLWLHRPGDKPRPIVRHTFSTCSRRRRDLYNNYLFLIIMEHSIRQEVRVRVEVSVRMGYSNDEDTTHTRHRQFECV